jgi:hypothetical protein
LLSLFGCASEAHPDAQGDTASALDTSAAAEAAAMTRPDPAHITPETPAGEPGAVKTTCKPREVRDCRFHYTDASGQRQCPMSFQICQVDGKDWLPCGLYRFDADGNPQKTP